MNLNFNPVQFSEIRNGNSQIVLLPSGRIFIYITSKKFMNTTQPTKIIFDIKNTDNRYEWNLNYSN